MRKHSPFSLRLWIPCLPSWGFHSCHYLHAFLHSVLVSSSSKFSLEFTSLPASVLYPSILSEWNLSTIAYTWFLHFLASLSLFNPLQLHVYWICWNDLHQICSNDFTLPDTMSILSSLIWPLCRILQRSPLPLFKTHNTVDFHYHMLSVFLLFHWSFFWVSSSFTSPLNITVPQVSILGSLFFCT